MFRVLLTVTMIVGSLLDPILARADLSISPIAQVNNPVFDFGAVSQGVVVKHDFLVKNIGQGNLRIQKAVPACGCTVGTVEPDLLAPNQEGTIHVEFNTAGFSGSKVKTVSLYTNDPDKQQILLTLKGAVEEEVAVEPGQVFMTDVYLDQDKMVNGETSLTIESKRPDKITLRSAKTFSKYLELRETSSTATKKTVRVLVKADTPVGEYRDKIIVSLKGSSRPSINIPVYCNIVHPVRLSQSVISFGLVESTSLQRKSVKLENMSSNNVAIKNISVDNSALAVNYVEIKKGKVYVIHVELNPEKLKGEDLKSVVSIQTDEAESRAYTLNVIATQPPR